VCGRAAIITLPGDSGVYIELSARIQSKWLIALGVVYRPNVVEQTSIDRSITDRIISSNRHLWPLGDELTGKTSLQSQLHYIAAVLCQKPQQPLAKTKTTTILDNQGVHVKAHLKD